MCRAHRHVQAFALQAAKPPSLSWRSMFISSDKPDPAVVQSYAWIPEKLEQMSSAYAGTEKKHTLCVLIIIRKTCFKNFQIVIAVTLLLYARSMFCAGFLPPTFAVPNSFKPCMGHAPIAPELSGYVWEKFGLRTSCIERSAPPNLMVQINIKRGNVCWGELIRQPVLWKELKHGIKAQSTLKRKIQDNFSGNGIFLCPLDS